MKYAKIIVICLFLCLIVSALRAEETTMPQLLEQLKSGDFEIKKAAIVSLYKIGRAEPFGNGVSKTLVKFLRDSDWRIRSRIASLLRFVRNKRDVVEPLLAALEDENAAVRINVVQTLGIIGDKRAIEPISVLLNDENEIVRKTAEKALDDLNK